MDLLCKLYRNLEQKKVPNQCLFYTHDLGNFDSTYVITLFFVVCSTSRWIPPFHWYIISLSQFLFVQYLYIASVQYSYSVAPPTLVATVLALNNCFLNILGM